MLEQHSAHVHVISDHLFFFYLWMSEVSAHATKSGVLQFHTILSLTLDGGQLYSFVTLPLVKDPLDPTKQEAGCAQSQSGHFGEEKDVSSMPEIAP
jgi:hypothetical protein